MGRSFRKCHKKMGDKITAKTLAEKAGVPTLPSGSSAKDANKIGYPIPEAAAGGGMGMRIVKSSKDLKESIASAEREAEGGLAIREFF